MSELDDIRAIVEVIDTGGFARAARQLGVSKSIVSRRIAHLETELGVRLLNRTTRGLHATEAGQEFKRRGKMILEELAAARSAVTQKNSEISGRLRLSLPIFFGIKFLAPILAELSIENPQLEIDVTYSDHLVDLLSERYDAAIRLGSLQDSTLVARRIAPVRAVIVASPDYLERYGSPTDPRELAKHQCLLYSAKKERLQWQFQADQQRFLVTPVGRFQADNVQALFQAALAGLGIAALPTYMVAEDIRSGKLIHLLDKFELPEEGIFVVRPPGAYVSAKVRKLIDLLVERFRNGADCDDWSVPILTAGVDCSEWEDLRKVGINHAELGLPKRAPTATIVE